MELIQKLGYSTLSLEEFCRYKRGELEVEKGVVITFDDGWRDNYYYAYPILKELGLKGVLFLVTEWVEEATTNFYRHTSQFLPLPHNRAKEMVGKNPGAVILNWGEIEKMGDVFQFASHTHSHRDFYFKREYSWEEEFQISREILKKRGYNSTALCWPRGKYTSEILELGKKYFTSFWTTQRGVNLPDGDLSQIKRVAVKNSVKWLKKQLFIFSNPLLGKIYSKLKK
jgi:peptidoglycan/xylan/chitin deacetylase (PgdA/CDA1 family)